MTLWERIAARLRALLSDDSDQALVRARATGETLVAVLRLLLIAAFVAYTLLHLSPSSRGAEIAICAAALVYAGLLLAVAMTVKASWVPWASTAIDVTLITGAMVLYFPAGNPVGALSNRIFFESYFFVLVTGTLRYDWRLCLFGTLLALGQFSGLSVYVNSQVPPEVLSNGISPYVHSLRLILLSATGVSSVVVAR
ncbi:MAG TPA: hypothetical protein VGG91_04730, partial [Myxococcaceae bacterium]